MIRGPLLTGILSTLLLTLIQLLTSTVTGVGTMDLNALPYVLLANALIASLITIIALKTPLRGKSLAMMIFTILFVIGHFNTLIEAYIFNVTDRLRTALEIGSGALTSATFAILFSLLIGTGQSSSLGSRKSRSSLHWVGRILVADIIYLFLYLIAGGILYFSYPPLGDFYEGKIPPMGQMVLVQLLLRGLIFAGITALIIKAVELKRPQLAILTGLIFAVIGGIAPLLTPNDIMPQHIRLAHGIEVGISNLILGVVLVLLLWRNPIKPAESTVQPDGLAHIS